MWEVFSVDGRVLGLKVWVISGGCSAFLGVYLRVGHLLLVSGSILGNVCTATIQSA